MKMVAGRVYYISFIIYMFLMLWSDYISLRCRYKRRNFSRDFLISRVIVLIELKIPTYKTVCVGF